MFAPSKLRSELLKSLSQSLQKLPMTLNSRPFVDAPKLLFLQRSMAPRFLHTHMDK